MIRSKSKNAFLLIFLILSNIFLIQAIFSFSNSYIIGFNKEYNDIILYTYKNSNNIISLYSFSLIQFKLSKKNVPAIIV